MPSQPACASAECSSCGNSAARSFAAQYSSSNCAQSLRMESRICCCSALNAKSTLLAYPLFRSPDERSDIRALDLHVAALMLAYGLDGYAKSIVHACPLRQACCVAYSAASARRSKPAFSIPSCNAIGSQSYPFGQVSAPSSINTRAKYAGSLSGSAIVPLFSQMNEKSRAPIVASENSISNL